MKTIFSILLFLSTATAAAQDLKSESTLYGTHPKIEEQSSRKHFILEVGYIGANSTSSEGSSDIQHGFSGGFLFDLFGEHYLTFETGAFITQQGYGYAPTDDAATKGAIMAGNNVIGKVTYIGIPLLAKLNFAGRPTDTLFLIGGVSPQMLVAKSTFIQATDSAGKTTYTQPTDTTFDPPSYDISGIAGLGGTFKVSETQSILLQATYNRGFVAVDGEGNSVFNQSFLFTVGFGVDL